MGAASRRTHLVKSEEFGRWCRRGVVTCDVNPV